MLIVRGPYRGTRTAVHPEAVLPTTAIGVGGPLLPGTTGLSRSAVEQQSAQTGPPSARPRHFYSERP